MTPFDERCKIDPDGIIKDLLAQIKRQATTIAKFSVEINELKKQLEKKEKKP